VTLTINGIQIDIQAVIIIDLNFGNQLSFQNIYYARVTPTADTYPSGIKPVTLCSKAPCKNGGYCVSTSSTTYDCLCTAGWDGSFKILMNTYLNLQKFYRYKLRY
jgi:hypothetical protein